ncbi:MAG: hypothetical protein PHU25_09290 [Deltaproteobacteria bacterium]|nr:hypothetical protein [Deltaproteobacteria bacterium]
MTMNYLYAPESIGDGESILKEIREIVGDDDGIEMFRDSMSLSMRLRRLDNRNVGFVVILATKRKDLLDIISICEGFHSADIVLLVPDGEQATVTLAHLLRPRFFGRMNRDLPNALNVLRKLHKKNEENQSDEWAAVGTAGKNI